MKTNMIHNKNLKNKKIKTTTILASLTIVTALAAINSAGIVIQKAQAIQDMVHSCGGISTLGPCSSNDGGAGGPPGFSGGGDPGIGPGPGGEGHSGGGGCHNGNSYYCRQQHQNF